MVLISSCSFLFFYYFYIASCNNNENFNACIIFFAVLARGVIDTFSKSAHKFNSEKLHKDQFFFSLSCRNQNQFFRTKFIHLPRVSEAPSYDISTRCCLFAVSTQQFYFGVEERRKRKERIIISCGCNVSI